MFDISKVSLQTSLALNRLTQDLHADTHCFQLRVDWAPISSLVCHTGHLQNAAFLKLKMKQFEMLEKRKEKRCHVWHVMTCPTTSLDPNPVLFFRVPNSHGFGTRLWRGFSQSAAHLWILGPVAAVAWVSDLSDSIRFYHIPLILCYIPSSILWYFLEHSFELCFAGQVVPLGFICWHWKIHRCQGEIVKSGSMQPPCFPKTEPGGELGGAKFRRRADEVIPKGSKTELPLLL